MECRHGSFSDGGVVARIVINTSLMRYKTLAGDSSAKMSPIFLSARRDTFSLFTNPCHKEALGTINSVHVDAGLPTICLLRIFRMTSETLSKSSHKIYEWVCNTIPSTRNNCTYIKRSNGRENFYYWHVGNVTHAHTEGIKNHICHRFCITCTQTHTTPHPHTLAHALN